ncbi:hypothetical protein ACFWJ5_37425, partial [Streptomyces qaidamensis]|uniref:hypothetical protein n=1 Tax=Streptomyces qaidamensis TaxID=1783515 RepID=UPI0036668180
MAARRVHEVEAGKRDVVRSVAVPGEQFLDGIPLLLRQGLQACDELLTDGATLVGIRQDLGDRHPAKVATQKGELGVTAGDQIGVLLAHLFALYCCASVSEAVQEQALTLFFFFRPRTVSRTESLTWGFAGRGGGLRLIL